MSRYIPKSIDKEVKTASGFRCAWCGVYLTERHHIIPYNLTKSHDKDSLILLCPTCHAEADAERITADELIKRRIQLSGEVDRSSGNLSINSDLLKVNVGGNSFINCNNILVFNDIPLISVQNKNGYLLVSLKLFNREGNLICWMNENRWWVENQAILDFKYSKNNLSVFENKNDKILDLTIKDDLVEVCGLIHLLGDNIQLSKDKIIFKNSQNQFISNTFSNINNAIVIKEKSFTGPIFGNCGILFII